MKITNIDTLIEEFRNGRDIWSRTTVELAVREIERLRKRIVELEQERRWISVEERLPEEYEYVLLWKGNGMIVGNYVYYKEKVEWRDLNFDLVYPTHWQPLPQPPKESE